MIFFFFFTESQQEGASGFTGSRQSRKRVQHGHQIVFGDGVEEPRSRDETLQAGTSCGHETSNQNDPFVGPRQISNDQAATNALSKPVQQLYLKKKLNKKGVNHQY